MPDEQTVPTDAPGAGRPRPRCSAGAAHAPLSRGQAGRRPVLLAVLGFAAVVQVQADRHRRHLRRRAPGRPDPRCSTRCRLASQRAEHEIADLERHPRLAAQRAPQARQTALEQARQQAEHARHPRRHPAGGGARRRASRSTTPAAPSASTTCSTASRSCATPAPRRSRSTTRSGWSPRPRFADGPAAASVVDGERAQAAVRHRRDRRPAHPRRRRWTSPGGFTDEVRAGRGKGADQARPTAVDDHSPSRDPAAADYAERRARRE